MVLSNKKLKQRIRAQLAESLAKSVSQSNQPNLNEPQTRQSFKSLLSSATQKPKLSKREKRRVNVPSLQGGSELEDHENGVEEKEIEEGSGGLKKNKKRKREKDGVEVTGVDEEGDEVKDLNEKKSKKNKKRRREKDGVEVTGVHEEGNEVKDLNEKKSKKKKKKKKKKQKKTKKVKEEEGAEQANGGSEEQAKTEAIQTHTSKEDASISTKIYVGGIPYYSTVDDIRSYFEGCGSITEIDCLKFPETGKFNGIAMISFRTEAAAKRALALDGSDMGGLSLKIQPYKATRDKKVSDFAPAILEGYNRIYIGNLSWDVTEDEIKKLFSDCTISSIRLGKDKETGEFRGFAHVDFADSLSLTMALKLDQKPLFGRSVRIRCAVPPKSLNPKSKPELNFTSENKVYDDGAGKVKGRTCYECGEKGHLSSSCPNKQAADVAHTGTGYDDVAFDEDGTFVSSVTDNFSDGKVKRTCYECGEKGHCSSLCPKKQAADLANDVVHAGMVGDDGAFDKADASVSVVADNISDGKLKRRTCYECGERGHLSSSCSKKQAADVVHAKMESDDVMFYKADTFTSAVAENVSDGKLRRRTCYECGERGHLSSMCPKKQDADVANICNDVAVEKAGELKNVVVVDKEAVNNVVNTVSGGKLRRRTCYECGEKGHLSSLCPNKNKADVANPSST